MNDLPKSESPAPSPSLDAQTVSELRAAIESLRGAFQVVALSGIVLSATLMMYLYKEVSVVRRQNDELIGSLREYQTNVWPKVEAARTNLPAFAKTNPTIVPILRTYFTTNAPTNLPPATAARP